MAITPLALDHQQYLGDTLQEIAAEKAAIIRPGVTTIVGPQPPAALEVILKRCLECKVFPSVNECATKIERATEDGRFVVSFETPESKYKNVVLGLRGKHQIVNVGRRDSTRGIAAWSEFQDSTRRNRRRCSSC